MSKADGHAATRERDGVAISTTAAGGAGQCYLKKATPPGSKSHPSQRLRHRCPDRRQPHRVGGDVRRTLCAKLIRPGWFSAVLLNRGTPQPQQRSSSTRLRSSGCSSSSTTTTSKQEHAQRGEWGQRGQTDASGTAEDRCRRQVPYPGTDLPRSAPTTTPAEAPQLPPVVRHPSQLQAARRHS